MAKKINSKRFWVWLVWAGLIGILLYTRLVNLGWGLPYPMHPDERNMADSIMQMECKMPDVAVNLPNSINGEWDIFSWIKVSSFNIDNCFNPHFFAYGQFPLYVGYFIVYVMKFFDGDMGMPISFQEATLALRYVSALSSMVTVYFLVRLSGIFFERKHHRTLGKLVTAAAAIIVPYAIQFAHFGTTESLLMMFYTVLAYLAVSRVDGKISDLNFVFSSAVTLGMALATKVSSAVFFLVPVFTILAVSNERLPYPLWYRFLKKFLDTVVLMFFSLIIFLFLSPHNIISYDDFIGSMRYESGVALGQMVVFYTRQFIGTEPIIFQLEKIFPYTLGIVGLTLFIVGFFLISWTDKRINLLRIAFLGYFLTSAFMYAKWSRFMAPVMPIMTIFAALAFMDFYEKIPGRGIWFLLKSITMSLVFVLMLVPGFAYLSIYEQKDVRQEATEWIYTNIPENSYVLSETGNVVDIPLYAGGQAANYNLVSFDFYSLDQDPGMQADLAGHLGKADYIIVPSRRIFANHGADQFPMVAKYYDDLLSGRSGFELTAQFTSYPKITFDGKTLVEFPDERSEETWTVFDHPVVRIFRKI